MASPEMETNATFFAIATSNSDDSYDVKIVDSNGTVYIALQGYKTMSLPDPIQADLLEPLQRGFQVKA
jgi:hypothetical protein